MKSSFQKLINSEKPILIDFHAAWCGPCKSMSPIISDLAKNLGDDARIIKIDIDKNKPLTRKLGIRGVPTFMLYKNGELLWRASGMQTRQILLNKIQEFIK